ncbi:MAG TPA: AraC family transcriptional regulator [Clostridia bacterium]|nr:AraC family transcriptional regulator [Clostridia bacterium]
MTLQEIMDVAGMKLLTPQADLSRTVRTGYGCDLLSWVLAHGQAGMAWITVQTHLNVIAVATLMDMACVILPEGILPEKEMLDKAAEEGIAVFSSDLTSYSICGILYAQGVGQAERT